MLTREETERLAAAIHGLRPGWALPSLTTFIWQRRHRALLDLTLELAWVAQLPDTKTPARIDTEGPWKNASHDTGMSASAHISYSSPEDCAICGQPEAIHAHVATYGDHKYLPRELHRPRVPEPTKEAT